MLIVAAGAEERYTESAVAVGPWSSCLDVTIDTTLKLTGAASFKLGAACAGNSQKQINQGSGWWSYAALFSAWGDGTYMEYLNIGTTTDIGWAESNSNSKIRLVTATGTYLGANEHVAAAWIPIKIQFVAGVWKIWAQHPTIGWRLELTRDDSGTYVTTTVQANLTFDTDETKGAGYVQVNLDDLCCWDSQGDNWNSLLAGSGGGDANADFPRISAAHLPNTVDAKTESDAGQAALLDELPPTPIDDQGTANAAVSTTAGDPGTLTDTRAPWVADEHNGRVAICSGKFMSITDGTTTVLTGGTWSADPGDGAAWQIVSDRATATADEYWTDIDDFNAGAATIQAVMVTHAAGPFTAEKAELSRFNYTPDEGTTVYADVEEGGRKVQFGTSYAVGEVPGWNVAGYFPWTPEATPRGWDSGATNKEVFEGSEFGISVLANFTNQMTVQAIYFGSSAEWAPPGAAATRRIFIT